MAMGNRQPQPGNSHPCHVLKRYGDGKRCGSIHGTSGNWLFLNAMAMGNLRVAADIKKTLLFLNTMAMGNPAKRKAKLSIRFVLKHYGDGKRISVGTLRNWYYTVLKHYGDGKQQRSGPTGAIVLVLKHYGDGKRSGDLYHCSDIPVLKHYGDGKLRLIPMTLIMPLVLKHYGDGKPSVHQRSAGCPRGKRCGTAFRGARHGGSGKPRNA